MFDKPVLDGFKWPTNLTERQQEKIKRIIRKMFADCEMVMMEHEFHAGFTNTFVFLVKPDNRKSFVIKIGLTDLIEQEYQAYTRSNVKDYMSSIAKMDFFDERRNPYTGLKIEYAGNLDTVKDLGQAISNEAIALDTLRSLFNDKLFNIFHQVWRLASPPRLTRWGYVYDHFLPPNIEASYAPNSPSPKESISSTDDKLYTQPWSSGDIWQLQNFVITELDGNEMMLDVPNTNNGRPYRIKVTDIPEDDFFYGENLKKIKVKIQSTRTQKLTRLKEMFTPVIEYANLPQPFSKKTNPVDLLNDWLGKPFEIKEIQHVHGDLHIRNILVSEKFHNVTIIDFGKMMSGYVLLDLCRLELSLIIDWLPQQFDGDWEKVYQLYHLRHCIWESGSKLFVIPEELEKPLLILQLIHEQAKPYLIPTREESKAQAYYRSLLPYVVCSLKFFKAPKRDVDKKFAIHTALALTHLYESPDAVDCSQFKAKVDLVKNNANNESWQRDDKRNICQQTYSKWQQIHGLPIEINSELQKQLLSTALSANALRDIMAGQTHLIHYSHEINFNQNMGDLVREIVAKLHSKSSSPSRQNGLVAFLCAVIQDRSAYDSPLMDITQELEEYIREKVGD